MGIKTLIIGGTGGVGTQLVKCLEADPGDLDLRYASFMQEDVDRWHAEGKDAVLLDLDNQDDYPAAFEGVERVFLLSTYSADMLYQCRQVVEYSKDAGVKFIVHQGVYSNSRHDYMPHFNWHAMVEDYIANSGIAWCNVHPNMILDRVIMSMPLKEKGEFYCNWGKGKQGITLIPDIAAVEAQVLREGPEKHNGKDYWLSSEILDADEMVAILSEGAGREIKLIDMDPDEVTEPMIRDPRPGFGLYGVSSRVYLHTVIDNKMPEKLEIVDDVMTVCGRPAMTLLEWAKNFFNE